MKNTHPLRSSFRIAGEESGQAPGACVVGRCVSSFLASAASAVLLLSTPASAQLLQIAHQSWDEIAHASGTDSLHSHMNNPRALSFDVQDGSGNIVKKVLVNWQANRDYAPWPYYHGFMSSTNGEVTYGSPITTPNVDMMTAVRRLDGTIVAVPFFPKYPAIPTTSFTFTYHTSTNNGTSWNEYLYSDAVNGGVVSFAPHQCVGMRFHRGIIEENNGDLYAVVYVAFTPDDYDATLGHYQFRSALVKSTNGGRTWNYHSTIQVPTTVSCTETAIVRCADGSWLAVHRSDSDTSGVQDLKQHRSTNGGLTWSTVVYLPGLSNTNGVDPQLMLMPNGILVLTYGYNTGTADGRHVRMAFSTDGNGTTWSNDTQTFTGVSGSTESTGYTASWPVSAHRFAKITDTGISWSYSSEFPGGNPYSIRQKVVDLVRTERNRIDLKTKYGLGALTVTTDMNYANATHPEARVSGAFDGSTNYWSGAFKSGTSGTYTIDLLQAHTIDHIGICLPYNTTQSATIELSANGSTWTTVKTYTNAKHNAINYTNITNMSARYARVTVTGAGPLVGLNEIELYSTADTFENYAQNQVPYGYSAPNAGFWVSEGVTPPVTGYKSYRGLYMNDSSSTTQSTITKTVTASATKTFDFRVKTLDFAPSGGAIQFHLKSGASTAFHLAIFSDGSVKYYNGTSWLSTTGSGAPAGAGTVPLNTWKLVKLVASATTDTATLYVDGVLKGTVGFRQNVSTIDSFLFGSGGSSPVGDQALFDDVSIN